MPQEITDYGTYQIPKGAGVFLSMEVGDNRIRICSNPTEILSHEVSKKGEAYKSAPCTGDKCELCAAGKVIKYKYAYLVLSRKDAKPYIYEAPITVFRQIVAYATNPEYGDPKAYDLTINKQGTAPQVTYTVMASPKPTPLTKEEEELLASTTVNLETAYSQN